MFVSRLTIRLSRSVASQRSNSLLLLSRQNPQYSLPILSNHLHSLTKSQFKVVDDPVSLQHLSVFDGSVIGRFRFSSTAAPQPNEKETTKSGSEQGKGVENEGLNENAEESATAEAKASLKENESDSDLDLDLEDLSRDDLVKLVSEKEEILKMKHEEFQNMKDKYMRTFAEMENVMGRTKREAENSKKYAIQNFAKGLLDVADNLGRAGSVVKESFSKIDQSADTAGAGPLLKTLLEGVEMTDKQLAEVLKKAGVEKFDPLNEQFDPNKHNAIFQVPDPSKPAGTVAAVLKVGYMLHDRIIRPAEVGVTVSPEE
ncbi:primary active transporter [Lithospermum erythrorhizon]|uniref:GrpE protein homolog n=1 Tax=Lithospermum erythrorhizon TaxID=34254 RepID=A0AAV3NNF8_LITER